MRLYQIFHTFLCRYYATPRGSSNNDADIVTRTLLEDKQYILYRQWPGLHDNPWRIPWRAGEVVSMNALCSQSRYYDGGPYCIRCGRYNSLNADLNWGGRGNREW